VASRDCSFSCMVLEKVHTTKRGRTGLSQHDLPRRERQILDIIYSLGRATAQEVQARLPDEPSYSAVRATLRGMAEKGLLAHAYDGPRYVYSPTVPKRRARKSALKHLVETFFDGSTEDAVATLLDLNRAKLDREELDRLAALIESAKAKGQ
jgi:BlaI family transcriptional regulator, penicillinase repressor